MTITDYLAQLLSRVLGLSKTQQEIVAHFDASINTLSLCLAVLHKGNEQRFQDLLDNQSRDHAILESIRDVIGAPQGLIFSVHIEGSTLTGVKKMTLKPNTRYRASVALDPPGSRVDGELSWSSSDLSVIEVEPESGGMAAEVSAMADGVATLTVSGDADLGDGVRPIEAVVGVIVGLEATGLAVSFEELGPVEG